ncbi:fungal specific transcription factor domain-containing protein [Phanerochaete sordida]|uniref:Fungal specific transcription factor domain-containing protein n=1 Tax=Phanerochaete sordida TaxID=48140 RepID=A0A9P3G0Q8_9APHY|nr:fungal specific transcription factor domain-containing protein [Phanerochaete sordida]
MDSNASGSAVKKQELEMDVNDPKSVNKDAKPSVRTLNRVPRACNACRKQKMRCEGAENPPCRRCRHAGLECLFEKPQREASLTGEAGLERIRSLEGHVAEIRASQTVIQNTLAEIAAHLRGGAHFPGRSPSMYPPSFTHQSPHSIGSPGISTPTVGGHPQLLVDTAHTPTPGGSGGHPQSHMMSRQHRDSISSNTYQSPTLGSSGHRVGGAGDMHPPQVAYGQQGQSGPHGTTLPPFSSLETMGPPRGPPSNVSSMRYHSGDHAQGQRPLARSMNGLEGASGSKRALPPSSNVTSADSTDQEEDDGELPASGLVAPWEVLRGLADVAIERAAQENGEGMKRRRVLPKIVNTILPDVVTKKIIPESEARELFRIFYHGCSTFLPVFDANIDTFDELHERSPFAVDCICMVAARVRDGGGEPSDTFLKCQEEVHQISCASLFSPVSRQEAVQAMVLVSGWSDNGWLSGGHAVRMAMEISMHKAWPELLKRMKANKISTSLKERQLVVSARTWFCLYIFEHQMSYGTGRPAILKDDESIWNCRLLLQHPLAIEDDMRLVSMVELMAIRERIHNNLSPLFDRPVDESTFQVLRDADVEFRNWYQTWDQAFSQKYEDAAFYRQSLQIQHMTAELFHNATALRGIELPEDVQRMPPGQKELAIRSIQIGRQILDITVNSPAYREGMKYAVHYTHATATFSASFLMRLARLFPDQCDVNEIRMLVEHLAALLQEVPGTRYAFTLQLMLKRFKRRKTGSMSRSPQLPRPGHRSGEGSHSQDMSMGHPMSQHPHGHNQALSPTYDSHLTAHPESMGHMGPNMQQPHLQYGGGVGVENIWHNFETTSAEQLPVWLSDQTLGGASFSQNGIDAFLMPNDYLPPAPQIW